MIGEEGVTDIVDFGEDVSNFVSFEMRRGEIFERDGLGLSGSNVLVHLVEMALGCLRGAGVILLNVLSCKQRPANEVAFMSSLDPG